MKGLLPAFLLLMGCAPDIQKNAGPGDTIVVQFDPGVAIPVVPTPNDLALDPATGKVVVPSLPGDTPAQTEFNKQYLGTLDGFPYESTASVLVRKCPAGEAQCSVAGMPAPPVGGALNPSSVSATSVVALDLGTKTSPLAAQVALAPTYDPATDTIAIPPPSGGWLRAHQYAVALLAGPNGLVGADGEKVIGSPTWELVSSPNPLVTDCPSGDITSPQCRLAVDIIPSPETDPGLRLADQLQSAQKLEPIRAGYAPLVALLETQQHLDRAQIPILWTFTIVDAGEVTFDPANGVIPFPNDVVRSAGAAGKIALPNPKTGQPLTAADCATTDTTVQLYCGLNTLDGFSTIAAPISENSDTSGAVAQANIDQNTLSAATVGLTKVGTGAPAAEQTMPSYTPCLNCVSSPLPNGQPQTSPQQLQWRLDAPLDERTQYLAWVSSNVKDDTGKGVIASPAFALTRLANPLVDASGHSTVNIITDDQAKQLEPLRSAMQPAIDGLAKSGLPRTNLTLAWAFTTQSEASLLDPLRAFPSQLPPTVLPDTPLYVYDATPQYSLMATSAGLTNVAANVGKVLVGVFLTPVAVTGPGGTLDPSAPKVLPVTFTLAVPKAAPPPSGYPLTIFGHGFTRSHGDFLAIAGALADPLAGSQATIATDVLFHGERSSCTGSISYLKLAPPAGRMPMTDDDACANPSTQTCNKDPLFGRCVAKDASQRLACRPGTIDDYVVCGVAGQGACVGTGAMGFCEGGDLLRDNYASLSVLAPGLVPFQRPVISGWNIFSLSNFFSTRDNFRQQVIDLAQLVRIIGSSAATSLAAQASAIVTPAAVSFDRTKLGYVGQSLGGILGTLYNAVSPETTNVVLNVPGGDLPQIILNAPSFAPYKQALVNTLAAQTPSIKVGTPAFDQFIGIAQWILDPADPANMAWRLTHPVDLGGGVSAPNANRKAFVQFIEGDETVPNLANFAVVTGANRTFVAMPPHFNCTAPLFCYEFTEAGDGFDTTSAPPSSRHGFLLAPPSLTPGGIALTTAAQRQVATFLAAGQLP